MQIFTKKSSLEKSVASITTFFHFSFTIIVLMFIWLSKKAPPVFEIYIKQQKH